MAVDGKENIFNKTLQSLQTLPMNHQPLAILKISRYF